MVGAWYPTPNGFIDVTQFGCDIIASQGTIEPLTPRRINVSVNKTSIGTSRADPPLFSTAAFGISLWVQRRDEAYRVVIARGGTEDWEIDTHQLGVLYSRNGLVLYDPGALPADYNYHCVTVTGDANGRAWYLDGALWTSDGTALTIRNCSGPVYVRTRKGGGTASSSGIGPFAIFSSVVTLQMHKQFWRNPRCYLLGEM